MVQTNVCQGSAYLYDISLGPNQNTNSWDFTVSGMTLSTVGQNGAITGPDGDHTITFPNDLIYTKWISEQETSFLQLRGGKARASNFRGKIAKLEEMSAKMKVSQFSLAVLQAKVARNGTEDPYQSVRNVIKKLLKTTEDTVEKRASVKAQCDEIAATNNKAKYDSQMQIDELLVKIEGDEAFLSKTSKQVDEVSKDLSELKENEAEAIKLRAKEKASNEAVIKEAEEGKLAAANAQNVLSAYYGGSATKVQSFLLQDQQPEVTTRDYKGDAAERSSGILGMLDVVIRDFGSRLSKTKELEKMAASDHEEFKKESDADIKTKEGALETKNAEIASTKAELAQHKEALDTQNTINLEAKQALEQSKAMCDQDSGKVRKEERDANIASLKQILVDLDGMISSD